MPVSSTQLSSQSSSTKRKTVKQPHVGTGVAYLLSGLRTDDFRKFILKFNEKDKDLLCVKLYFSNMF